MRTTFTIDTEISNIFDSNFQSATMFPEANVILEF